LTAWTWTGNIRKEATTRRTSCCCWRVRVCDCVRPSGSSGSVQLRKKYIERYVCVTAWDPVGPLGLYSRVTSN
jgi:hypothetical protein